MNTWALVVAGGTGSRFGAPKQFADLAGKPVVAWSLDVARAVCAGVVLVVPADRVSAPEPGGEWPVDHVVAGGDSRSESVRAGLTAVPAEAEIIAVHDAARPLAGAGLWRSVVAAVVAGADAAVPATPLTDTVKRIDADGHLVTLDRTRLVTVQTPQAFRADWLRRVHESRSDATDDAALVEAAGGRVELVEGPPENLKVTRPHDLVMAAALIGAGS